MEPAQRDWFGGRDVVEAHAVLLGERLATSGLDQDGVVASLPLTLELGQGSVVVLFRYGVAVFFDADAAAEQALIARLADRVSGRPTAPEDERTQLLIRPGKDEMITPAGAIQLARIGPEPLMVVADALAKSVALAQDEHRVEAVYDALEPFARGLAARGRPPGGRRAILRMIGRGLLVQHRVSGRVAAREKPEILWDRPDLERLYARLEDEYELSERSESLQRKLQFISSSAAALVDLMDADRSARLELVIVALILAELALAALQLLGAGR